jgi:bacillithiol synthase
VECISYPFDKLPFSELFVNYIENSDSLSSFYQSHPFDDDKVREFADAFAFPGNRIQSVKALHDFNSLFDAPDITHEQIAKLKKPESLSVVTGQQLTLYGGPLFTIYKTITAVIYAKKWEKLLNRPVITVFWLADEDHDYEEAGEMGLFRDEKWHELSLSNGSTGLPVGREKLGSQFRAFESRLFELLPESDFTSDLKSTLKKYYREGKTFRDAFGRWFLHLFAKHGVVLAGSDDPAIKKLIIEPMLYASQHSGSLYDCLEDQSNKLEANGYSRQAFVQDSNLFYIDPEKGRVKLEHEGESWKTGNGQIWSNSEIVDKIRKNPGNFSPNVFLRPLMQDRLVPTLAYVTGPGELAYYGQMKSAYEMMEQKMPLLIPRFSITLKEPAIDRIMKELPIDMHEYAERIEDLESLYIERTDKYDVEEIFSEWQKSVRETSDIRKKQISKIDPTLEAAADKAGTLFNNELDELKKKVYRSIKKKNSIQLNRIHRIRENLFPGNELQERQIAFIYYMNKYGLDLWDRLLVSIENEVPDTHKIVQL